MKSTAALKGSRSGTAATKAPSPRAQRGRRGAVPRNPGIVETLAGEEAGRVFKPGRDGWLFGSGVWNLARGGKFVGAVHDGGPYCGRTLYHCEIKIGRHWWGLKEVPDTLAEAKAIVRRAVR